MISEALSGSPTSLVTIVYAGRGYVSLNLQMTEIRHP